MRFLYLTISLLGLTSSLFAATILQNTFSAQDLVNQATFPTRTFSFASNAINFNTGSQVFEKILDLSIISQGTLSDSDPVTVSVTVDAPALTGDNDLMLFLTDGTNTAGALRSDTGNSGGLGHIMESADIGNVLPVVITHNTVYTGAGFNNVFQVDFVLQAAATNVTLSVNSASASRNVRALDRTAELSLLLVGADAGERYQVNSISVSVEGTAAVPEPSSWALLLFAVALGVWRKK